MDHSEIQTLAIRLKQHEEIISQLLEIIAVTNQKVEKLSDQLNEKELSRIH